MNRKAAALAIILALPLFLLFASCQKKEVLEQGKPAPNFKVLDVNGQTVSLSSLKGSVVILNFWATWCPPCREEVPSLSSLYSRFKGNPDFKLVSVVYNDDPAGARQFLAANHFDFPVYSDPGGMAAVQYGLTGVPETSIIDKKGILQGRVIGPMDWNSPEVVSDINNLLRE